MRDYSIVKPRFWLGSTGKNLRKNPDAQRIAFYLMTGPQANMLGLYYLPITYIMHEVGMTLEEASKGLQSLIEEGFCRYDYGTEMVWVTTMLIEQVGDELKPKDNQVKGIQNKFDALPKNPFFIEFYKKYKDTHHIQITTKNKRMLTTLLQAPSEPLRSQEQDQEQEIININNAHEEKKQNRTAPNSAAAFSLARWGAPELIEYFNEKCGTSHLPRAKANIHIVQKLIDGLMAEMNCDAKTAQNHVRAIIDSKAWDMANHPNTKARLDSTLSLTRGLSVIGELKDGKFMPPPTKEEFVKNKPVAKPKCKTCDKVYTPVIGAAQDECMDCEQKRPWCKCAKNRTMRKGRLCKECDNAVSSSLKILENFKTLSGGGSGDIVKKSMQNSKDHVLKILGDDEGGKVLRGRGFL